LRTVFEEQQELCKLERFSKEDEFTQLLETCKLTVKDCESKIQKQQNVEFDLAFHLCLEQTKISVIGLESDDLHSMEVEHCATLEKLVEILHFVPAILNVKDHFAEIDRRCDMRRNGMFLFGDQHDLNVICNMNKTNLLSQVKELMVQRQSQIVDGHFIRCLRALNEQTLDVVENEHVCIGDEISVFEFEIVRKPAFIQILKLLKFRGELISEIDMIIWKTSISVLESLNIVGQLTEWFFVQIIAPCIELCVSRYILDAAVPSIATLERAVSKGVLADRDTFRTQFLNLMSESYSEAIKILQIIAERWNAGQTILRRVEEKESLVFEAAKRECKQQDGINCIEEISAILAEGKLASADNQQRLVSALDALRESCLDRYPSQITLIKEKLAQMQNFEEVHRLFTEHRDSELTTRYETLCSLYSKLGDHFLLDTQPIVDAVNNQFDKLIVDVNVELARRPLEEDFLELKCARRFGAASTHFSELFPQFLTFRQAMVDAARQNLDAEIATMKASIGSDEISDENVKIINLLLVKNWGLSHELQFSSDFVIAIRTKLLEKMKPEERRALGEALKDMQFSDKDKEAAKLAGEVMATFPEFRTFAREIFNGKASAVSFEDALAHPLFKTEGEKLDHKVLLTVYSNYDETYELYVNLMCNSIQSFPQEEVRAKIQALSAVLKGSRKFLRKQPVKVGELVGLVAAQWSYLTACEESGTDLRRMNVKQPHGTQILGIFCLLGIGSSQLADRLIQIGTGEGKSVSLGMSAALFALFGFQVDVVCYSRYLSERDYAEFKNLFHNLGVDSLIHYNDINQLTSRVMQSGTNLPNARKAFLKFLSKGLLKAKEPERIETVLLMDEVDVFFDDAFYGNAYRPSVKIDNAFPLIERVWKQRGLLSMSSVGEILEFTESQDIMKMYPNLSLLPSDGAPTFIEEQIQDMLEAVLCFPLSGPCHWPDESMSNYTIDHDSKRIGYIDSISGVPDYDASFGYYTAFTYLQCIEKGELKQEDLMEQKTVLQSQGWFGMGGSAPQVEHTNILGLQPRCGTLTYSEIPRSYSYKFGMSGTLNCLTSTQNTILVEFGFGLRNEIPSTFNKQMLHLHPTEVLDQGKDDFFDRICAAVTEKAEKGMAVLVILEDEVRVNALKRYIKDQGKIMPDDQVPLELTGRLDKEEREQRVRSSTRHRQITFVTRTYGRGTDFVCHDSRVKKFGGVHLIITFFPHDDSENRQLEGRTCRQDDPGSSQKIIWIDDLKYLGSDEPDFKPAPDEDWDDYLKGKREKDLMSKYKLMIKNKEEHSQKHKLTVEACGMVQNIGGALQMLSGDLDKKWNDIAKKFGEATEIPLSNQPVVRAHHVVFVLDESISMTSHWQDLIGAVRSFLNLRLKAGAHDMVSIVLFHTSARTVCEMMPLLECESQLQNLLIQECGATSFGPALIMAQSLLVQGLLQPEYSPLLMFMSDGDAYDGEVGIDRMRTLCSEISQLTAPGCKWEEVGEEPTSGIEISNNALAEALHEKVDFTVEELIKFKVSNLSSDCYIKANRKYFKSSIAELQVKTIAFGSGASHDKLQRLAEPGGGEFLLASDGFQLKQCFRNAAASLVKTHFR